MDESLHGQRDARGHWSPKDPLVYPPVVTWPLKPTAALKWVFKWDGYLWPWNSIYLIVATVVWWTLTPSIEAIANYDITAILILWLRNACIIGIFFGAFHVRLYVQKHQGIAFKFNPKWPEGRAPRFMFRNQTIDNLILTFASGVTIWTAFEIAVLAYAANTPWISLSDKPIYAALIILSVPLWRDLHFYLVHRLIHWGPLYRLAHQVHHKNINPGPWSGLAMHPIEHLLYFTCALPYLLMPFHPLFPLMALMHAALSPAPGHAGFEKIVLKGETAIDTHCFNHYLHHKYFECNYADGVVPFDKWFGTFHDGTPEAQDRMKARLREKTRTRV